MLKILKNIRNSFFLFAILLSGFSDLEAKNSKDVSNTEVKRKTTSHKKKYSLTLANSKDGHPVRSGKKSYRFEVRLGDCGKDSGHDDCKKDRQRTELQFKKHQMGKKDHWYSASIYLPENYQSVAPVRTTFAQLYEKGWKPILMITDRSGEWLEVGRMWSGEYVEMKKAIRINDMRGKWTDVLVHANWSFNQDGFFKTWINNELKFEYKGRTLFKTKRPYVYLKFGIYRSFMSRWRNQNNIQDVPGQVLYFDEVRVGKSKKEVVGKLPPLK